ncbi:MAG TPA: cobaltochelatase subunit CobN, partial [Geminicoccaceae bacterium]
MAFPTLRLAKMARLRHPMSVDLYVDGVIAHAKVAVIRCLGGLDYWRYGIERAGAVARANGVKLAVLPGDDRPDPRLDAFSTVSPELTRTLDAYLRAGGPGNLRQMLRRLGAEAGWALDAEPPKPLPRGFVCCPGCGPVPLETALQAGRPGVEPATGSLSWKERLGVKWVTSSGNPRTSPRPSPSRRGDPRPADRGYGSDPEQASRNAPLALVLVYRSAMLGGDTAPTAALAHALATRGLGTVVVAVSSLKDPDALDALRGVIAAKTPDIVVAATAFSAREDAGFVLDAADCPVIQAFTVGAPRAAWEASARGLGAADLAMQVALPEFDGRLSGFPISFKEEAPEVEGFGERRAVPYPAGIAALADRAAAWVRLARTPRAERRLAIVLSDYPARGGRAGFAVGLDTPESARAIVSALDAKGYGVGALPEPDPLMRALT